ncbi:glycosyltransferase family A protein [Aminobacter sp. AP02]|uniref:glycosyltransferase family 2 protein n=1 Tax=Aminobacter sp. AP02 TaxID=2135737 RepID=UPI000D6CEAEB|nr:glycosyltransferase family A protein [Aminobacter sp. AP02]
MPCYNYGRYLYEAAKSVLQQPGVDIHLLIIDDKSSDNTPEVCQQLSSEDSRVTYIRHKANKGHIATYNEGLSLATTDYVLLLSADDLLTPGSLARATALMDHNPSVGLAYGYAISLRGTTLPPARPDDSGWTIWKGRDWIARMCKTGKNFIVNPEAILRTSVQHEIGGYRPSLPHSGDMEMWMRAAAISDVGYINGADQAYYRIHDASMQRTVHAGFLFDLKARHAAFQSAFESEAGRLPDAALLLATARRSLGMAAIRRASEALAFKQGEEVTVEAYCEFALSLDPEIATTRLWHRLQRSRSNASGPVATAIARGYSRLGEVADKYAWRRWWHTGVY